MKAVHAQAEEARQKLASLGVAEIYYEAGKDLSAHYKQPAVTACEYDPSITADKVPLLHNQEYLLLLRLAMEKTAAGAYARSQLAAKRQEIEMAYHQFDEGTPEEKAKMLGSVASILVPGLQVTKAGKVGKVLGEVEDVVSQAAKDALQGIKQKLPNLGPVVQTPEGLIFKIGEIPDTPALPKTPVQQRYMDWLEGQGGRVEGTDNSNSIVKIVKDGNKTNYKNPAGNELSWTDQHPRSINNDIDAKLNSSDPGKATEAKVASFVRENKEVTGFGQQVKKADNSLAGDLDVVTKDEIIEVKKSIKAITDVEQFDKYINPNNGSYFNPGQKKVILC
ncbi:hypothetical protein MKY96_13040 [Paenibacillus sp. FSL R7-0302]|uniref:hypothetical protein n=1 Tax=Paenibacillus sp. FSL R7-0302 TaxID=2921681 RepID=UPI0030FC6B88